MASPSAKIPRGQQSEPPASARRERLYQELARKMMRAIDAGKYKVGERLPAERELAVEFDVSRPTVREAIISLEVQGLVEVRLGTSAYVRRKPSQQDQPGFNVTAFELTEARLGFEGEAAALAATQITDEELDELDALVRRIDRENRSENGKEKADHEFHLLIARASRNAAVLNTIESLWRLRLTSPECTLLFERARDAHVKPVVAEHTAIVKALRSRNPAKAREAMRAHMNAVMESLLFATEERAVEAARRSVQQTKARFGRVRR
jgi:GntR family transcriptional repressor for pyruvate dehydrogenase complex